MATGRATIAQRCLLACAGPDSSIGVHFAFLPNCANSSIAVRFNRLSPYILARQNYRKTRVSIGFLAQQHQIAAFCCHAESIRYDSKHSSIGVHLGTYPQKTRPFRLSAYKHSSITVRFFRLSAYRVLVYRRTYRWKKSLRDKDLRPLIQSVTRARVLTPFYLTF